MPGGLRVGCFTFSSLTVASASGYTGCIGSRERITPMKELKRIGDADQKRVSAIERVARAFSAALTPWNESDSPLAEGVDKWGSDWLSDDVARIWATRGGERLVAIVCPSSYGDFAAEVVVSGSSAECDTGLGSWVLASLVAELRRQGLEGEIGYADCMRGALAVALPEGADS